MQGRLNHFLQLVVIRIILGLKSEASRHHLSYAWWVLEPALETAVFYVVFGIFMNPGTENFLAFLLVALVPWSWFARSVSNAMNSIVEGGWLLSTHKLPPIFFPLVVLGQDWVKHLLAMASLLLFLLIYGVEPSLSWLYLPAVNLIQLLLVASLAVFLASVMPGREDFKLLVNSCLLMLMFSSGIFYDPDAVVGAEWTRIFYFNPVACLISVYRGIFLEHSAPNPLLLMAPALWTVFFSLAAYASLRRRSGRYAKILGM